MKSRLLVAVISGTLFACLSGGVALAAKPNHQGCLGADVSGYAQGGSEWGQAVSGLATSLGGIGEAVQAHLAGLEPDEVIPNSCND